MTAVSSAEPMGAHTEVGHRPGSAHVDSGADHTAFPALDGLRAVAVAAVMLTHAAYWTGRYERGFGAAFLARMDSGVAVFFVISGFLLFRPWLVSAARRRPSPSLRVYLIRRAVRILPAYWLAVALCLLLLPQNGTSTVADWWHHVFLLQTYQAGWLREGLTQTWSLCVEVAFYLVLPAIGAGAVWWLRRPRAPRMTTLLGLCGVLALISVGWYVFLHSGSPLAPYMGAFWLPGYLLWFAAGLAMAILRVHLDTATEADSRRWQWAETLGSHPLTCWSVTAATVLLTLTPLAGPRAIGAGTVGQQVTKTVLYAVLAASIAWPAVFGRSPVTTAVLANRVSAYLGTISYGVFLYHLLVLDTVMRVLGNAVFNGQVIQVFPLTALGSVALAAVSFRVLERPMIRLGHRHTGGPATRHRTIPPVPPPAPVPTPAPASPPVPALAETAREAGGDGLRAPQRNAQPHPRFSIQRGEVATEKTSTAMDSRQSP